MIDVLEVALDPDGKAYDQLSGGYLKIVQTETECSLLVGTEEGRYVTLTSDMKLAYW